MRKKIGMVVIALAAVLLIGAIGLAAAGNYGQASADQSSVNTIQDGNYTEDPQLRIFDRVNLTDEQEQEIKDTVIQMIEDGADHEEIRDTVRDMVEGYGIELPEPLGSQLMYHGQDGQGQGQMNKGQGQNGQGNGQKQRSRDGDC